MGSTIVGSKGCCTNRSGYFRSAPTGIFGIVPAYADEWHGVGPLGGIATCLNRINNGLLLVLAIDLPQVQPAFLQRLLARTEAACGIVPILNDHFEPLIAVYPKAALELAVAQLRKRDYVLQHFVAATAGASSRNWLRSRD